MKVLIVEDHSLTARAIERCLAAAGWEVRITGAAESALPLLAAESFDAVLLDIGLPGMMGFSAITEFRARNKAPIIIMTGFPSEDGKKDSLLLGAADYWEKPLDFDGLSARIARTIAR
ncbi:MAG: hypothetical protein A2X36_09160 [Elusimicrobia bacterium GWA2_69_24]|nr:MAG: hypothetical protein A2X36_09160 [Elusimicrobia bacterium GWA2_69_24]HBL18549.1 hypothetical protein [Elusimicrobiota bacterium]